MGLLLQKANLFNRLTVALFWVILGNATITLAQSGRGLIRGTIKTADGQPAEYVNVIVKGTSQGATANQQGQFEITRVLPGTYIITASFTGLETKEQSITVHANENTTADFVLNENTNQLEEVIVHSSWNKFAQRQSDYVARMPLKPLENAQVYNSITKELAQEQVITDFKSVLKNAPGVTGAGTQNPLGRSQLMIRGFSQIFTLKNGMQVYSNFSPDPITIEKADVIKGPSATLFGAAAFGMSYGGFVNQQTKKPYDSFGGEISFSKGSWNLNRLTADVNVPLNTAKTVLFRLNAAVQTENTFRDFGYNRSYVINPELLFKVNDRLTVRAELSLQNNVTTNTVTINPIGARVTAKNWKDLNLNYTSSWMGNDVTVPIQYTDVFLSADYKLSESWRSQTNVMVSSYNSSFDYINVNVITDSTLVRQGNFQTPITNLTNIQQNFIGDFQIGRFRNRLLIGGDYLGQEQVKENVFASGFVIDTVNYRRTTQKYLTAQQYGAAKAKATLSNAFPLKSDTYTYGLYIADVFNVTDRLILSAGLRFNAFDARGGYTLSGVFSGKYAQNNFAPKFGLIYQPIKDRLSLFANYQNGFTNVSGSSFDGTIFKPEQANQWEVGVKTELGSGLSGSVSYYNINVTDKLRTDVAHAGFSVQDANQISQGLEADIIYNPLPGLNILAGYGHNTSQYVKTNEAIQGKRPANVANDVANFWLSYRFSTGQLRGLGAGFGGNYTSDAFADDANTFVIPAYTLYDATLFYDVSKFRIGLKMNNLTNVQSWNRWGSQPLRQVIANVTIRF